jgi:hypothetical protein
MAMKTTQVCWRFYIGHDFDNGTWNGADVRSSVESALFDQEQPFTVYAAVGRWCGAGEPTTVVEFLLSDLCGCPLDVSGLCRGLKQQAILMTRHNVDSWLVEVEGK